ncbi:MAG: glycosyltransferase [Planctomycetota bacterium]
MSRSAPTSAAEIKVSVIVPTLNGGDAFPACLEGIAKQEGVGSIELIVLDSQSEDETVAHAERAGARVIEVDRALFRHGATRDSGARHATGDVYVFTVQDARAVDEFWLQCLVEPLLNGSAAATSRILPRPEANPLARRTVLDSPMASPEPWEADPKIVDLAALSPEEARSFARFDDISSAIRADIYEQLPFRPVSMSEDLQWGLDALGHGFRLAYAPDSKIYHSHEYSALEAYFRYRDDALALQDILGLKVRKNVWRALKGWAYEMRRDFTYLRSLGPGALMKYGLPSVMLRGFQLAGQWRGSR